MSTLRLLLVSVVVLVGCSNNSGGAADTGGGGSDSGPSCPDFSGTYSLAAGTGTACSFSLDDMIVVHQSGCNVYVDLPGGLTTTNGDIVASGGVDVSFVPPAGSSIGLNIVRRSGQVGLQISEMDLSGSGSINCVYDTL